MNYLKYVLGWLVVCVAAGGWMVNNWTTLWMLMEVSTFLFVGLLTFSGSYSSSEVMLKYFIVQALTGLLLGSSLLGGLMSVTNYSLVGPVVALFIKLGLAPAHQWVICMLGKISWFSLVVVLSLLKLVPVLALSYLAEFEWLGPLVSASILAGSVLGINEAQLQKLLGYSGMVGVSWLLLSAVLGTASFFFFFAGYLLMLVLLCYIFNLMNVFYLNQFKMVSLDLEFKIWFFLLALSFSGIPPFLGFLMKWFLCCHVFYLGLGGFVFSLVVFSLFSIVYYLQLWYYFMFINSFSSKWYMFSTSAAGWGWLMGFLVFGLGIIYMGL